MQLPEMYGGAIRHDQNDLGKSMRIKVILTGCLLVLFISSLAAAETISRRIKASETDQAIDQWDDRHYVYFNPDVAKKNNLFVFLPGTGLGPASYKMITQFAAEMGFHAFVIAYANPETVSRDLCGTSLDVDCTEKVRLEIFDGTDRSSIVRISRANSIENRIIKLLAHLDRNFPGEGWGQYLSNGQLAYSSIIFAGHSQGAGHAAIIGKNRSLRGVMMFGGGADAVLALNQMAPWVLRPGLTDKSRLFGFTHMLDMMPEYSIIWGDYYGMAEFGGVVNVDSASSPYNQTHMLTTRVPSEDPHGAVVRDTYVPMNGSRPAFAVVWEYMLAALSSSSPPTPVDELFQSPEEFSLRQNYPNPFNPTTTIDYQVPSHGLVRLAIYTTAGQLVRVLVNDEQPAGMHRIQWDGTNASGQRVASGVYLYRISAGAQVAQRKLILMK